MPRHRFCNIVITPRHFSFSVLMELYLLQRYELTLHIHTGCVNNKLRELTIALDWCHMSSAFVLLWLLTTAHSFFQFSRTKSTTKKGAGRCEWVKKLALKNVCSVCSTLWMSNPAYGSSRGHQLPASVPCMCSHYVSIVRYFTSHAFLSQ